MPGRLEFETEFDNEGESAVKDLVFRDDDTAEEIGDRFIFFTLIF